ncbi:MAG TPA: translocation/assembly module TamB domain-containing protein [Verrucomicrobiae bacterium]
MKILAGALAGAIILILALPLWFPWLLRLASSHFGLNYISYDRIGYNRFALISASFTNRTIRVQAGRIEAPLPTTYAWQRWIARHPVNSVTVRDWNLQISSGGPTSGTKTNSTSVHKIFVQVERVKNGLQNWLPETSLTNGALQVNQLVIKFPGSVWKEGVLNSAVQMHWLEEEQTTVVAVDFHDARRASILVNSGSLNFRSAILLTNFGNELSLQSTNTWRTNEVALTALFSDGHPGQFLPLKAALTASAFTIPATWLGLTQYQDLHTAVSLHWETNRFTLTGTAAARPKSAQDLPPVDIEIFARGDTNSAVIEKAHISSPWLTAKLTDGTPIQYRSPFLLTNAALNVTLNLNEQPWIPAQGQLIGRVWLTPGNSKLPNGTFSLAGTGIQYSNVTAKNLRLEGDLTWPQLRIVNAEAQTADGSSAILKGIYNFEKRFIRDGQLQYEGKFVQKFLPTNYLFSSSKVTAHANGSITNLSHSGHLEVSDFALPKFHSIKLATDWQGQNLTINSLTAALSSGKSKLEFIGAVALTSTQKFVRLEKFTFLRNGKTELQLEKPFSLSFAGIPAPGSNSFHMHSEPLHLTGTRRDIQLEGDLLWPNQGNASAKIAGLDPQLISDFIELGTNQFSIQELSLTAAWSNAPVHAQLKLIAHTKLKEAGDVSAICNLQATERGVTLNALTISNQNKLAAVVSGFVPITFEFGHTNGVLKSHPSEALEISAKIEPEIFAEAAVRAGLQMQRPALQAKISGKLDAPKGVIQFQAQSLRLAKAAKEAPPFEDVNIKLVLDRHLARLEEASVSVSKQVAKVSGQIPLGPQFWSSLLRKPEMPDWKQATLQLKIDQAQLGAFSPLFPAVLSPEGHLDADVALVPGGTLAGHVTLSGARTRPLASIGAIRDIMVRMRFEKQRLLLEAAADAGGQPVPVTGNVDLRGDEWLKGKLPPFELKIGGAKVPLARTPELILKADLDITVSHDRAEPVIISGSLHLRDGFFLQDLSALKPSGGVASPKRRPPYFSVEQGPLADWRLRVSVTGEKFLKVQSPLFHGQISTGLRLTGTLREPLAVGEVKIDAGEVRFPFANLPVTQGLIILTSEDPYRPQVNIISGARTFGYDVKMEVSGTADAPLVQFTSTPALSSEQVLLMVTAGELPHSELNFTATQRAQRLAMYLGKDLLSQLGFSGGANRLTIRSGEDISEAGKPTYSVEYKMTEGWSIIGEYDRFNDFNLMLKWRIYSK